MALFRDRPGKYTWWSATFYLLPNTQKSDNLFDIVLLPVGAGAQINCCISYIIIMMTVKGTLFVYNALVRMSILADFLLTFHLPNHSSDLICQQAILTLQSTI